MSLIKLTSQDATHILFTPLCHSCSVITFGNTALGRGVRNWQAKKYQVFTTVDKKQFALHASEWRTHFRAGIEGKQARIILRNISDTILN